MHAVDFSTAFFSLPGNRSVIICSYDMFCQIIFCWVQISRTLNIPHGWLEQMPNIIAVQHINILEDTNQGKEACGARLHMV